MIEAGTILQERYRVEKQIGQGGMGAVFIATDERFGSTVAIKETFFTDEKFRKAFEREARLLNSLRHAALPRVSDHFIEGNGQFIVMEFIDGEDLSEQLEAEGKPFDVDEVLGWAEQLLDALEYLHSQEMPVIHRDIKPQNLLLTADKQTVKIADFGVARFSASDSPITRVGTNIYAPPEHSPMLSADGKHFEVAELTPAADIYSLAKTAYVLFTCESPRIFSNQPITELPFAFRQEAWAKDLLEILQKATLTDPKDRHQDIYEFWKDFTRLKVYTHGEAGEVQTQVSTRSGATPKAHVARGYTPLAPQKPDFNTSKELKFKNNQVLKNPALVVKVDNAARLDQFQNQFQPNQPLSNIPVSPQPPVEQADGAVYQQEKEKPRRQASFIRQLVVALVVTTIFVGILYGTHSLLRGAGILPELKNPFSKPVGTANSDVNLRIDGNANSQIIGLVPEKSRVRIVNSTDNWYEVDIIEYGRPKKSPTDADHGWVYKRYIDVEN